MEVIGSSPVSPTNLQYRWRVSRLCERPGCSAVASVAYGFDTKDLVVWIGALTSEETAFGVGVLCRRHADALVVPKGWRVDDRRESVPRLFTVKPVSDVPAEPSRKPVVKRPVKSQNNETPVAEQTGPGLFDDDVRVGVSEEIEETRAIPWMPAFGDDDIDEPVEGSEGESTDESRSGLLARAFGNKDRRERR